MMSLVLPPVEQLDSDIQFQRPGQLIIVFCFQETNKDRHMRAFSEIYTIRIYHQTQFVAMWVCVERRAHPLSVGFFSS